MVLTMGSTLVIYTMARIFLNIHLPISYDMGTRTVYIDGIPASGVAKPIIPENYVATDTACTTGIDLIRGIVLVILPKPDKVRELLDLLGNGPSQNHRQLW